LHDVVTNYLLLQAFAVNGGLLDAVITSDVAGAAHAVAEV
jgi:hypothetical protein